MKKRMLGALEVSEMGLGCMGMSEYYGEGDDAESIRVINAAVDRGVTLLDTADMYGIGRNEELVGKAVASRRSDVVIATKFGNEKNFNGQFVRVNGRPEYVKSACEASLRRLRIDVIDLYYQHRVDPEVPIEDTVGAMADLVREGKVRFLGLSEAAPATIRRACSVHPITALQTEYSLWTRDVESEILPVCRQLGIGFVPYSPLGRGFLTGKIKSTDSLEQNDFRRIAPRFSDENIQKNLALVARLEEIAKEKSCKPSQLALAWLLKQGEDIVPIPGTRHLEYLKENIESADITLSKEEIARIEAAVPESDVAGARYPEAGMKRLNL
jgi:aryl-alcohol dehydrogenase-like predicted oxidoreductase